MRIASGIITIFLGLMGLTTAVAAPGFEWGLPAGVRPPPVPADNLMSLAKVELGQRLFYESALSRDHSMSCGSCHQQHRAFSETLPTHPGVDGAVGKRNAPTLGNVGYVSPLTWANSKTKTLEDQVANPIFGEHPTEMGMSGMDRELVRRLSADLCYRKQFLAAFPDEGGEITIKTVAKAIAAFERTLMSFNSAYDRAGRGEAAAISEQARRGERLFKQRGCQTCHSGPNLTDSGFHNIGLPPSAHDAGLAEITGKPSDVGAFRTPTLRNVAVTGPFMHNGSIASLTEAILAHNGATTKTPTASVTSDEAIDISLFLETLTDDAFIASGKFPRASGLCVAQ